MGYFFIDANTAASETTNKQNVNQTINAEQILVLTNEIRKIIICPNLLSIKIGNCR